MKIDWNTIRTILVEVEEYCTESNGHPFDESESPDKFYNARLLFRSGYIEGDDASSMDGGYILASGLSMEGHDLLNTIKSEPIWKAIQSLAAQSQIELTLDVIKALAKVALERALEALSP